MLDTVFSQQKAFFSSLRKESIPSRIAHLNSLEKAIEIHQEDILLALEQDFKKPRTETLISEIYPVLKEIKFTRKNLSSWTRPKKVKTPLTLFGSKSFVQPEPRGVCLIIGAWNYPLNLCLLPLVSAIAAGNCVIVKPSEISHHTSKVIKKIIETAFPQEHVFVAEGGLEITQDLLKLPFDHIFFTGSTRVGKIIMEAASRNLSSVTLELGGKSPTIVDSSAKLAEAAEKIVWAKFVNAGQTCIAPDYLFVHKDVFESFKSHLVRAIEKFYGSQDQHKKTPDFARIVSLNHAQRLKNLIDDALTKNATLFYGGHYHPESQYCGPTLLENVSPHSLVMQEEIFGPIFPMMTFQDLTEVIEFINERPKPLALYFYSQDSKACTRILNETSSGGLVFNDSVIHFANPYLPFGGVNHSGMGSYHGEYGFKNFSHEKAVLKQGFGGKLLQMTYPPYSDFKMKLVKQMVRWRL